jgi:DHA1 family bicyclomycin/chloramphenicol resistance-like MFS transporter
MTSRSLELLIFFRLLQALGGCVASVAATAMVRDFFPPEEGAKVFSLLMLILSVSPLFAPTVGALISTHFGWPWVFVFLGFCAALLLAMVFWILPEAHTPDATIDLGIGSVFRTFREIFLEKQFNTYTLAGSFAFSGLFAYLPSSPVIFMDVFHVTRGEYGLIFALLATGLIGAGQLNILLMKKYTSARIFSVSLVAQSAIGLLFMLFAAFDLLNLPLTIAFLAAFLSAAGLVLPNASALALAPFSKNAGSASALLGFLQIGIGAISSGAIGILNSTELLPIVCAISSTAFVGVMILAWGRFSDSRRIGQPA